MSSRIANFLLKRLRREAARDALDLAISKRWLAEEGEKDREDEDRPRQVRVGHYFVEDDELGPDRSSGRKLLFGAKLEGFGRAEIARFMKREGITLDIKAENEDLAAAKVGAATNAVRRTKASPGRDAAAHDADPRLVVDVVRAIRASAAPPPVDEIAVVLLLAEGIARSGLSHDQVLSILSERQPVVSILCPVRGFESRFNIMLKNGGLLPRPLAIGSGPEMRGLHVSFGTAENATKLVLFPGRQFDADDPSRMDARVGQAAASGYPLLGVAEKAERIPTALRVSASLDLECGPISTDLIARVMQEVLGPLPRDVSLDQLEADCAYLSLFDLPLAIRSGISHARAVEVLVHLGAARRREHDEDDSSSRDKSGWGSGSSSGSGKSPFRNQKVQGSGSDIIRPVSSDTIARDPFVPMVERLHGYGTASSWAMALKEDLELWQAGQLDWSALSAKLLLSGPPGTGKTSFAKALCNTLQVPLIATSVSTWLEASYLGDVVRRMKAAFDEAGEHAPCILFIDEIDGIGRRGQGKEYDDYWNTIVNKALELLDGAVRSSGIVIVGATNHPEVIDPALLRSGRLETHIRIPPPDIDALAGILRHHLANDFASVIATRPPDAQRSAVRNGFPPASATDRPAALPSDNHDNVHRDATGDAGPRKKSPRGA
ncbi:AAA family ATPase [Chelativorans sp. ZYF759]|uniref:AAA family ATPase n=1 Tax=Chelativorans sp. ZYF759 TaxID=2692213 RepID=UPI00145FA9FA|nr:ATP-binding protein [Chelativorans sp. ZYF759]NMG37873.1 AAA family ATPase [Chelativorans sp. ZYF759]